MTGHVLLCNRQGLGNDWAVSIIQQSGITPGDLAPHPFVSLESASQLVSAGVGLWPVGQHLYVASWPPPTRGQLAATYTWPVGHRLYGWVNGSHTFMNGQS